MPLAIASQTDQMPTCDRLQQVSGENLRPLDPPPVASRCCRYVLPVIVLYYTRSDRLPKNIL